MKLMVELQTPRAERRWPGWRPGPQSGMAVLLLGACAVGPGDSETSRLYRGIEPEGLYKQTLGALQESDLQIAETDPARGVIVADGSFDDRGWAECPSSLRLVDDQDSQQHLVEASEDHREVELTASVADRPDGARLTLEPRSSPSRTAPWQAPKLAPRPAPSSERS